MTAQLLKVETSAPSIHENPGHHGESRQIPDRAPARNPVHHCGAIGRRSRSKRADNPRPGARMPEAMGRKPA